MDIVISRPQNKDISELKSFIKTVTTFAFANDGYPYEDEELQNLIKKKIALLNLDFSSSGQKAYFLIAKMKNKIAGCISSSEVSEIIKNNLSINYDHVPEITTVYVLPDFHHQGIATILLNAMFISLLKDGVKECVWDAGYKKSQSFWIKKFGNPTVVLKDHWAKGFNHLIWHRQIPGLTIKLEMKN